MTHGTIAAVSAGNQNRTALVGPVSARFGRGRSDGHILYVSTDGLLLNAMGALLSTAGSIVALNTRACV
jgi:hypothetical protein